MKKFLLLLLFVVSISANAQTSVSGQIATNTTWTLANSPYIVTGNILVPSGVTLTIEPGVVVKVNNGLYIKIQGELIAIGTSSSKIIITSSNTLKFKGDWDKIWLAGVATNFDSNNNYVSGTIIKHCEISYANEGLRIDDSSFFLSSSIIENNNQGINFKKVFNSIIADNIFRSNINGTNTSAGTENNGQGSFNNNKFLRNTFENNSGDGLIFGGYMNNASNNLIKNNIVKNNLGSGMNFSWGDVVRGFANNVIEGNIIYGNSLNGIIIGRDSNSIIKNIIISNGRSGIAISGTYIYEGLIIEKNIIGNNSNFGIDLSSNTNSIVRYNSILNSGSKTNGKPSIGIPSSYIESKNNVISFNTIFNSVNNDIELFYGPNVINNNNIIKSNGEFKIKLTSNGYTSNAENNYWGTITESEIQLSIYDNSDNFERGIVSYSPFLLTPNTTAPVSPPQNVIKTKTGNDIVLTWNSNPESDITGYNIYYGTPTGYSYTNAIDVGNVNTYTIVGGNLNTEYAVTAYDSSKTGVDDQVNGNESWYSVSEIVPELPTGITADTAPRKIKLNWTLSSSADVSSYKIYRGTTSNPTTEIGSISSTATSFIDTSVTNGVDYFYRIKSVKPSGLASDFSANITAKSTNVWIVSKSGVTNGFGSNLDPILTIQSAITNASDGDEILVGDGVFNEGLLVNKEITLKSLNGYKKTTILRNSQFENIIKVFGIKNFKINGFSLVGSAQDWRNSLSSQNRGIKGELNNARISIQNCYFNNLEYAIHTGGGSFFDVNNSIFHNNRLFSFAEGGDNFTSDQQPKITHSLILDTQFAVTMGGANIVENFENTIIANSSALPREAPYFTTPVVLNKVLLGLKDTAPVGDNYKLIDDLESVYFKDYSNQDFSLKDSSPAIGYGNLILLNNKDLLGLTRPLPAGSNPDLGPIENLLSSPINASPKFNAIDNVTINEDAVQQIISITGISDGDLFSTQVLTLAATSNNPALIPNPTVIYTTGNSTGSIQFTPFANQTGSTTITIVLTDDGGTVGGGVNSVSKSFTITVTPVNDAPVALAQTISTPQDTNKEIILSATDIDSPVADLTYTITSLPLNGSLFQTSDGVNLGSRISVVPSVVTNPFGKIIYEPLWNVSGNGTGNFSFKANDGNLLSIAPEVIVVNTTAANYPTLSLNTSLSTIAEHQSVIVNATLSTALNKDINISLESLGTATNDIDFISQYLNKAVGEVKAGGNGVGSAMNQLNFPEKITVDSSGNLFIADYNNNRIQKWAPNSRSGETIISGVTNPMDVQIAANGDIFVLETGKVTKWTASGVLIGVVSSGISSSPSGMFIDTNLNIFTTGYYDNSVYKSTALNPTAVKFIDNPGLNFIHFPEGIVSDSTGNLYISNRNGNIVKWNSANQQIVTIISANGVRDLAINSKGNLIIPKGGTSRQDYSFSVAEYTLTGTFVKNIIESEPNASEFIGISGVALDKFDNLYVSQSINPIKYGSDFVNLSKNRIMYYPLAPQIKIPAGQISAQIKLQGIEDDLENEGDEKIILKTNIVPFTSLNTPLDIEIIIKDNTRKLTLIDSPFIGLEDGAVSWGDYDRDGDQDVAVMGQGISGAVTKVYENKNGVFVDTNQNFTRVYAGDIAWVDINKDGWLDLAVSGSNGIAPLTKIYINDKGTSFSSTIDFGLPQLFSSKMAWGDLDNDGDIDLAITGVDASDKFQFNIFYRDNTQNKFTAEPKTLSTPQSGPIAVNNYKGVIDGDIKIVDLDLDGDNDIVYNGSNSEGNAYSNILYNTYIKNSSNNNNINPIYSNTSLTLKESVIEVARIGENNKMSILSSGINQSGNIELYSNEPLINPIGAASVDLFPKLKNGDISVVDFNNDGLNDILFIGEDVTGTPQTKLYIQNSIGNFKLSTINLLGLRNSTVNWVDYDNDGDLDLFLTGIASIGGAKTLLYKSEILNKRNAAPAIPSGLVAEDLGNGKIKFQWTPPSDDYSASLGYVVRLGKTPGGTELSNTESNLLTGDRLITKLAPIYTNFYEMQLDPGKYYWSVQAVDSGLKGGAFAAESTFTLTYDWKILNQGGIIDRSVNGNEAPFVKLADLDNDNDLDLVYGNSSGSGSQILQFDGKRLIAQENTTVTNIGNFTKISSSDVGDIDGDKKADILVNYLEGTTNKLVILTSSNTVLQVGDGLFKSKSRMVDINNDGKLDIVIIGLSSSLNSGVPKLWIYEYDKTATPNFKKTDASADIAALSSASFDFGDIDKDQDLDLVITGFSPISGLKSVIYENTTVLGGAFKLTATDNNIVAIKDGTTDLIDVDGDGDLDVVLTGTGASSDVFEIYMNKLNENIKDWPRFASGLTAIRNGKIDLGDFNGDGYSDILYSGTTSGGGNITKLSEYNKTTQRYEDSPFDVSDFTTAEVEFGDLDGDKDLDFVIVGTNKNWSPSNNSVEKNIFRTYINVRNDSALVLASNPTGKSSNGLKSQSGNVSINDYVVNEAPSVPVLPTNASKVLSNITTTAGKYPIELNWGASTDDHTPSPGLTYAIKIGTTAGGEEIMSANANSDGTRKVSTKGNAEHNSKWKVSLPVGKYYWSVQAIDAAYSGSAFTDPQVFEVSATGVTVNNAPVAIADQITVVKGGTATKLNSNATSVLTNDTDTENNTLTAILVNNVTNGTLTLNSNGTFSYVHNGSDTTTDSFSYKANDGTSNSNTVVVTISIVPFAVDFNNFLIQTKSETCAGKNNGEINIKATQSFNYTATINTINYNFVNNSLIVPNLPPGEYNVCINVTGQSFQQCYKLTIGKGGSLTGKTSGVSSNKVSIEITEGSAPFEVVLNGKSQFTTDQNVFDLDVKVGDVVMVKSSVACEGIYSTVISDLPNSVVAYPNPTKGSFEITVPTEMKEIYVELYSINAVLISKAVYPVVNQKIQLHLDNQTSGTYIAKVYTAIPTSLMIIKN
jgi:hypothetical protein